MKRIESLVDKCVGMIQRMLSYARYYSSHEKIQKKAKQYYEQLAYIPSDIIPRLLIDVTPKQLNAIEQATHAQGCHIATEQIWREMCLHDFSVSQKKSPDVTWRMTYESLRRAAALKREEEWLAEELNRLRRNRKNKNNETDHPNLERMLLSNQPPNKKRCKPRYASPFCSTGPIGHVTLPLDYQT